MSASAIGVDHMRNGSARLNFEHAEQQACSQNEQKAISPWAFAYACPDGAAASE